MKKYIPIILALLGYVDYTHAQLNYFEAEGSTYYEAAGANPNSDIEFYSEKGGGKLLKKVTTNNQGKILLKTDGSFRPVFVLNRSTLNRNKIKGNGFVYFLSEREFSFQEPKLSVEDDRLTLSWLAAVGKSEEIYFEVFQSNDAVNFTTWGVVVPQPSAVLISYALNDILEVPDGFYKVAVISKEKGLRYITSILSPESNILKLYPSAATEHIHVEVSKKIAYEYKIINNIGQVVKTGTTNQNKTTVYVGDLSSGSYFFVLARSKIYKRFLKL